MEKQNTKCLTDSKTLKVSQKIHNLLKKNETQKHEMFDRCKMF